MVKRCPLVLLVAVLVAATLVSPSTAFRIPCIIPFLCSYYPPRPSPAPLTECWTPLSRMLPCAGFITNGTDPVPSKDCCDGFDSVDSHRGGVCFCRIAVGDFGELLPAPLNKTRLFALPAACRVPIALDVLARNCNMDTIPPVTRPSSPPPSS